MSQRGQQAQQASTPFLLPKLRHDIKLLPGGANKRDEKTWLLFDPVSDRYFRLDQRDYDIISHFQAGISLQQLIDKLALIGLKTDEHELRTIVSFLYRNHLFYPEEGKAASLIEKQQHAIRKQKIQRVLSSYISFKIPLFKPDDFLNATFGLVRLLFNPWTIIILAMIAAWGYLQLLPNWTRFKSTFFQSLNAVGLLHYSLAIIVIKSIHELAHAYTAKAFGIRAREFGVAFIVFFPRLYTDLTDSWRVVDRHKRVYIDAAGIIAELIIGGFAALLWTQTGSGPLHALSYFIFSVSIINTLLFNGNPLMRFDGYYLLSDGLSIDNLYSKASAQIRHLSRNLFWGITPPPSYQFHPWLALYGVAAFCYRLFLYTSIIAIVYFKFMKLIGIVLVLIEIQQLILRPLYREITEVKQQMKKRRLSFYTKSTLLILVMMALLFIPLPGKISFPGQFKSSDRSILYIPTEGFINDVQAENGKPVTKGQIVLKLKNPFIEMELQNKTLERNVLREELRQLTANKGTLARKKLKMQQLESLETIIKELKRKQDELMVMAPISGTFVSYQEQIKVGKWFKQGTVYGEIYSTQQPIVIAYVKEQELHRIRLQEAVTIHFNKSLEPLKGAISAIQDVPVKHLESTPLQDIYGGKLMGNKKVKHGWQSADVLYQVIITPQGKLPDYAIGRSVLVSIDKPFALGVWVLRKSLNFFQKESVF